MARIKDHLVISLDDAKSYLRVSHDMDDSVIDLTIRSAISRIDSLLGRTDIESPADVAPEIELACLRLVAAWYQTRRDTGSESVGGYSVSNVGRIPHDVMALITPYRAKPWL